LPSGSIRFVLDGEILELHDVDPTRTVLQFLREDMRRTGTKEGCAEGDCGACTVVLAELDRSGAEVRLRAVNSCIQFLPTLDGKELITVESLSRGDKGLHPVQAALVQEHGSQCGFCTPGFVMSLYALYESNESPGRREIDDALAGNLCRCTGYRPIIEAAQVMHSLPSNGVEVVHRDALREIGERRGLHISHNGRSFIAPVSIHDLLQARAANPDATVLAGGTDIGLWVTKQHRELQTVIYVGHVRELTETRTTDTHIEIGAAVTLTDAVPMIVAEYPGLDELFRRFASPPIRNAGTLGGNIANGSPIGDSMPALMAIDATLVLRSAEGRREVPLDAFYLDYQVKDLRDGEILEQIRVPRADERDVVSSYKWSKRLDQDISAVCTAYRLRLDNGVVASMRVACGGLAATVKRAEHCEAALAGQAWDEETIENGMAALAEDFQPIDDMRASADYRLVACRNLLRRFYLETRQDSPASVYSYGRQGR
jgi:xanthine dehydrogenase small subunit